jgi:hypothetical protein
MALKVGPVAHPQAVAVAATGPKRRGQTAGPFGPGPGGRADGAILERMSAQISTKPTQAIRIRVCGMNKIIKI